MKRYNLYLFFVLLSFALLGSCSDDGTYDNKVFVKSDSNVKKILIKKTLPNDERTIEIVLGKTENTDVVVSLAVDASLVSRYNAAYYDHAIMLPVENYELSTSKTVIKAGSVLSNEVKVFFKGIGDLDRDLVYVLPVTISDANINILQSARTSYFVLKGAALINSVADMEENFLHIDTWAKPEVVSQMSEVTMEMLLNARNYNRQISTLMGIEGSFLIRLGDANFPSNQIQIANSRRNFPDADSNKGLPTNEWVHVALTYSSITSEMKVYVNGKVQSEGSINAGKVSFNKNGKDGFYIGRSYADERFLAGEISECRIWNLVRTQEQIAENPYEVAPTSDGLVAYWKCDEGGGSMVNDYTGNENHLTSKKEIKWKAVSLPAANK